MFCDEHMNFYTIFQRAQLLETFSALQRGRFPSHKLEKRIATKTVNTLMPQMANTGTLGGIGDKTSREVKSAIIQIYDDFVLVR